MEMLMTADEAAAVADGATLDIWLEVKDATETISTESKQQIENGTSGYKMGQFIDISLFKKLSTDTDKTQITGTDKEVKITVTVPSDLLNKNSNVTRTYSIVRNHEGTVTILDTAFDAGTGTLTFETKYFSDYAIIYKDKQNSSDNPPQPTQPDNSNKPKTGDDFDARAWILLVMAGIAGMVGTAIYRKKAEDQK